MRSTQQSPTDTRTLSRWGVILSTLLMVVAFLPVGARAQTAPPPENVTTVNGTGERFILEVDGQKFDVEPEEMSIQVGALRFCETCTLDFGQHTFEAALKNESGSNQVVATLTTSIDPSDDYDYSLAFHRGQNGGYELSLFQDDVRPVPGDRTRVEVRHIAEGGAVDFVLASNGENSGAASNAEMTLSNPQWQREFDVLVNDYELRAFESGARRTAGNMVACNPDLELEGGATNIVYFAGQVVPASQLSDDDVREERGFADTCRDFADTQPSYDRAAYNDGFDLRGYNGPQMVYAFSNKGASNATGPTGPDAPYATTASTGGNNGGNDGGNNSGGTLPEGNADATEACPDSQVPDSPFTDISGSVHERNIECVYWYGVTQGTSNDTYSPDRDVDREAMAAFIARLMEEAGYDLPASPRDAFADDESSFAEKQINQLAEVGLVNGYGDGTFRPNRSVDRAEMAAFVMRALREVTGKDAGSTNDAFADDESSTHEGDINALAKLNISAGTGSNTYEPNADVDRAQMGSFLARALDVLHRNGDVQHPS